MPTPEPDENLNPAVLNKLEQQEDMTVVQLPLDCKAWYYENFLTAVEGRVLWDAVEASFDLGPNIVETPDGTLQEFPHGRFNFADEWIINSKLAEPWGQRKTWIEEIRLVKERVEAITERIFDACVGYYYPDGSVSFPYHYDMPCFDDPSILAAVSLGYDRTFSFPTWITMPIPAT